MGSSLNFGSSARTDLIPKIKSFCYGKHGCSFYFLLCNMQTCNSFVRSFKFSEYLLEFLQKIKNNKFKYTESTWSFFHKSKVIAPAVAVVVTKKDKHMVWTQVSQLYSQEEKNGLNVDIQMDGQFAACIIYFEIKR